MCILSIDVGIKNLAMCLIDQTNSKVIQWDVSGVPPKHEAGLFPCLRDHLDARPWVLEAKIVLIEKQPGMNKTMKTVENFLHSYCVIKNPSAETIIYDARHKVPDVVGTGKTQYRKRKQVAIERCREFLEGSEVNSHWLPVFHASKKKDDLADTVLQSLSFINSSSRKTVAVKSNAKSASHSARKPNENQRATKYSVSNLMWFVKNETRAKLEADKRFMKDLKRYYSNFDELLATLG
jgi:hypothetical protein